MRIGFHGTEPEDLNQAPIFARPVVRIGLPAKFSVVVAAPPPIDLFGVTPRLLAFGLERPLFEGERWTIGWRGYGQVGSVRGAFTCPTAVLAYGPGTVNNPTECVGRSSDVATLRYIGNEFQLSYRIPGRPRWVPHAAVGGNFIDGVFHVRCSGFLGAGRNAALDTRRDAFPKRRRKLLPHEADGCDGRCILYPALGAAKPRGPADE